MEIFIYGEDSFRLNEKLKELKQNFLFKNTPNAPLGVFDFKEKNYLENLEISLRSRGLFVNKNLVVVKNVISSGDKELKENFFKFLEKDFKEIKNEDLDIIFYEETVPPKNDKIFKWFLKNVDNEEYKKLNDIEIKKWIKEKFADLEVKELNGLEDKLLSYCGDNLLLINNEILKISNYLGGEKKSLTQEELDSLLNFKLEADIFKTIEFLSTGNKKKALETLHQQLDKGDDPFYILSMYIYQFRNLLKIADFYFEGMNNNFEIAKLTKLHPFVVQKGMQQLRGLTLIKLKTIYQGLEKIDIDAKIGKQDVRLGLELLITKL